jgi:hypothetical protein
MQRNADDADDVMAGIGRYFGNHFGADKERHEKIRGPSMNKSIGMESGGVSQ